MDKKKEIFIIGLGNPGKEYLNSRHNIGFLLIKELSKRYNVKFVLKNKLKSQYSEVKLNNVVFRLFMPTTYMNQSGDSLRAIVDWYKIDLDKILIIVDDIDIPLGKIRYREKGSSGGHNGLKSIINKLQTEDFKRIRIGIGSPPIIQRSKAFNTISHVLGSISNQEEKILKQVYKKLIESIEGLDFKEEDSLNQELNSFNIEEI